MAFEGTKFFSAVLLCSENPERLVAFYREIVGIPLEDEQHGDTALHYGCELGDLHFAIHPAKNFEDGKTGVGAVKLAFEVFDMSGFVKHVESKGGQLLYPPKERGPMTITAMSDPDGNMVEFTQMGDRWMKHLDNRRGAGHCMIETWKKHKALWRA